MLLDQRENRSYLKTLSSGQSVLNLFSYSGGFSVAAGVGGARQVTSVDIAENAIKDCDRNWSLNGLSNVKHTGVSEDVFSFLEKMIKNTISSFATHLLWQNQKPKKKKPVQNISKRLRSLHGE
ncbi:MAG: class I SAM-dependent methyltransferase [Bdellovibrionales bacterium]